jgi:2-polyprenyl-3-methyl-5-hydroxy-6-metoxy-1,4-benzoquinol methylase
MATLFHKQVLNAPLMPVTIDESIFTSDIISAPGEEMIVAIEIEPIGKTALKGNAWMFQRAPDSGELKLVIISTGSQLQAVGEEVGGPAQTFERETNTQMVWKEDPGFLNDATFHALTSPQAARSPEFYEQLDFNEKAALIYLDKVKDMPVVRNPETAPLPHLQHYCRWISDWTSTNAFRNAIGSMGEEEKASILEKSLKSGSHEGAIIRRIGLNLPGILGNTVNSLDLMLEGSLLSDWYKEGPMLPVNRQMVEYFNTLTHKNPQMNILEVGAGTGSAAAHLFNALGDNGRNLIKHYCYTDISAGFFEQGRSLPNKWKALLDFKVLDVSKDPIEQGFEPNQFDLVIASNVLHATPSMSKTLENVRKLLKPGGRMLLLELVRSSAAVNIVFGTLPG